MVGVGKCGVWLSLAVGTEEAIGSALALGMGIALELELELVLELELELELELATGLASALVVRPASGSGRLGGPSWRW